MQMIKKIKSIFNYFYSKNPESFMLIFLQAISCGIFLQVALFNNLENIFSILRFLIILGISIIGYLVAWVIYALILSKLYLKRISRGAMSGILKYDAFSYLPLTVLLLIGLTFYYIDVLTNLLLFFSVGLLLVIISKILLLFYRPPNKDISVEEVGWQTKQEIIGNVTNLNADVHIAKMYEVDDKRTVRKFMINDELRTAINLKNSKSGKLTFNGASSVDTLHFSIGWKTKKEDPIGNLKLYLCNEKSDKMIFNKDASNILNGWNEYQIKLHKKLKIFEIRWENSIEDDIFLSISNIAPLKSKEKRNNIVAIVFDGVIPDTIGIYRGDFQADCISRFFKDSLVCTNVYVQGDWTMPNIMSIATSHYQSHHELFDPDLYSKVLSNDIKTVSELLQENGWNTFGYFGCHRTSPGYGHIRGYNNGIYRYTGKKVGYNNMDVTLNALNFLKKNQKTNNFLFLHYYGTHPLYFQNPSNVSSESDALFNEGPIKNAYMKEELGEEGFSYLQEMYFQKYKEIDENLSILFDYISKYESDCTTVILTSDHGTLLFKEDAKNIIPPGKDDRDRYLEEARLKIPFLIRFPKNGAKNHGVRNEFIEGNIDFMPTVLEIAGIQPPENIDGESILSNNKNNVKKTKDYAISESNYKDVYELLFKTLDFSYFLRTGRNRKTNEILQDPGLETFYDFNGEIITDKNIITKLKKKVSQILKENNLSNKVTEKNS